MNRPHANHFCKSGGELLVDGLAEHKIETLFGVPGESYLPVLDALYENPVITFTLCRHEGGAAMMAEAAAKMTGLPGVCLVSRGPGITNASAGIHVAQQGSTPLVVFVGLIGQEFEGREAFQEIDLEQAFGKMAKAVLMVRETGAIPRAVAESFRIALKGRPGPVVVGLPQEILSGCVQATRARPLKPAALPAKADDLETLLAMLSHSRKPMVIAGGGGWRLEQSRLLRLFAQNWKLPVASAFRRQDCLDNNHRSYAGDLGLGMNPALGKRVIESDLIIALGTRLGDIVTGGYTLLEVPRPHQTLIHIYPEPSELGRVYQPDLGVVAGSMEILTQLKEHLPEHPPQWGDWTANAHQDYLDWSAPQTSRAKINPGEIVSWLSTSLPDDAIICNGAGNYAGWVHRFFRYSQPGTQLAPISGSMGYGIPAGVAAKRLFPQRCVVVFAGDGCFQMHGQELMTAIQYGLAIIIIVVNNGMHGTIRMHQEREYPGRPSGTQLVNPDFVGYARACGGWGRRVESTPDFYDAFSQAQAAATPALIELITDPENITPVTTLSEIRGMAC